MKYIDDMTKEGINKLESWIIANSNHTAYDLGEYVLEVIAKVSDHQSMTYEMESVFTKSGNPETITFEESDFVWKEFEDEEY